MNRESDMIAVTKITKKFGEFTAVKELDLRIQKGELFGLLGPNGAGKTTLLSMLATTLKPTSGTATVNGFDVEKNPSDVRKSVGMIFQDASLDVDLTAKENLWLHARMYHVPQNEIPQRIAAALKLADLESVADKEVKKFSGGMKRRLEIVRGLMHRPEALFLDEPTLGLDPQTRRRLWDHIRELNRKNGLTMILTTHYMDEADELCDRIAIIDKGKIIALGTSAELKRTLKGDKIIIETKQAAMLAKKKPKFAMEAVAKDGSVTFVVDHAEKRVADVVLFAKKSKATIGNVTIQKPSLEDVFLHYTGKTIREAELDAGEQFAAKVRATSPGQGAR